MVVYQTILQTNLVDVSQRSVDVIVVSGLQVNTVLD